MNKQEIDAFLDECYKPVEKLIDSDYDAMLAESMIKATLLHFYSQMQTRFLENHNLKKFTENLAIIEACEDLHNEQLEYIKQYSSKIKKI